MCNVTHVNRQVLDGRENLTGSEQSPRVLRTTSEAPPNYGTVLRSGSPAEYVSGERSKTLGRTARGPQCGHTLERSPDASSLRR